MTLQQQDNLSIEDWLEKTKITFALPKTIQQADMLEALEQLTPQQRTELVTDWYQYWVIQFTKHIHEQGY